MAIDIYSGEHSGVSQRAIEAFERAVWNVLAHRPDAAVAIEDALGAEPDFVAAHALRALCCVSLARTETIEAAHRHAATAREALRPGAATPGEHALVCAAEHAAAGRLLRAADRLDAHLTEQPRDLLALKLSHGLRFMSGDAAGMLRTTRQAVARWSPTAPGYGYVLGCHSFALGENGELAEAERVGLSAVEHEPLDAWGAHAVGHVYETSGRIEDGIAWLEQTRDMWSGCNNFAFHMAWHLALCHMARGRADVALELYDRHVRPRPTDDFRDVANAVSLLWRLRQEGVAVGDRWRELAELAQRRAGDCSLVFALLHHLLTAVAVGDRATAVAIIATIERGARSDERDQDRVARVIGVELAARFAGLLDEDARPTPYRMELEEVRRLGGSAAQRDVFLRTLALLAAENGSQHELERVLKARGRLRADRFEQIARTRTKQSARTLEVA